MDTDFFTFGEKKDKIPEGSNKLNPFEIALMTDGERWDNYTNDDLYDIEVRMREFIETMSKEKGWCNQTYRRKFTTAMLVEILYGRPYDQKIDGKYNKLYSRIFSHYSSRIQKGAYLRSKGKTVNKTVYTISPKRLKKPPYSLKLRYQWLANQDVEPSFYNMHPYKDDLKPGHARNPRTDENMKRRREFAKEKYNERYGNRAH